MTTRQSFEQHWVSVHKNGPKGATEKLRRDEEQPDVYAFDSTNRHWVTWQAATSRHEAKIKSLRDSLTWALSNISEEHYGWSSDEDADAHNAAIDALKGKS